MPNNDYILRSDAVALIVGGNKLISKAWLMNALATTPAADVEPKRKIGRWIWDDEGFHCSECWFHAYGDTGDVLSGHYHYCPHCGARLEGGDND